MVGFCKRVRPAWHSDLDNYKVGLSTRGALSPGFRLASLALETLLAGSGNVFKMEGY